MGEEAEPAAPKKKISTSEWKHASWVSPLGKWAWLVVLINGIIGIIYGIAWLATYISWYGPYLFLAPLFLPIWNMIWGVIIAILAFVIIKPKFSNKCAEKDWDSLYGWVLNLGKLRFPWMLFWGAFIEIFGFWGWGGLMILIPAFVLLFAGPKKYEWTK
ncbi:MAG: hypothetical protein ACFFFB_21925 [Candidatus Heimdallarchaeota archaeon]